MRKVAFKYASWDRQKMCQLEIAYEKAVAEKKSQFTFDGETFETDYARYLLQNQPDSDSRQNPARGRGQ